MTKPETKAPKAKKPAKPAFALIGNAAELNAAIKSIAGRSSKLDADIHRAACSVIVHSAKHNDPDVATRLVTALGKSMRKQALVGWLCNYGAFTLTEAGELAYVKGRAAQVQSEANIHAAIAEPFWEFAPEPKYVQFDLAKAIEALVKKAASAMTNAKQDTALVPPDKLAALRALAEGAAVIDTRAPAEGEAK